jgi:hypothetical protein
MHMHSSSRHLNYFSLIVFISMVYCGGLKSILSTNRKMTNLHAESSARSPHSHVMHLHEHNALREEEVPIGAVIVNSDGEVVATGREKSNDLKIREISLSLLEDTNVSSLLSADRIFPTMANFADDSAYQLNISKWSQYQNISIHKLHSNRSVSFPLKTSDYSALAIRISSFRYDFNMCNQTF